MDRLCDNSFFVILNEAERREKSLKLRNYQTKVSCLRLEITVFTQSAAEVGWAKCRETLGLTDKRDKGG